VLREEVEGAVRMLFASGGRPAEDAQVMDFLRYVDSRGISTHDLWVAERSGRMLWSALPVFSAGRTMLLLAPVEVPRGADAPAAGRLIDAVCVDAGRRGTHLAQVLLDPSDVPAAALYAGLGFRRMAELIYLQTSVRRRAPAPVLPPGLAWLTYSPGTHGAFAAAIADSYGQSLDCPGLNGLRDIEDVIAGHKATGEFDPDLWFVLVGQPAGGPAPTPPASPPATTFGTLLLSRLPRSDAVELVYLGLSPLARRRGLGTLAMRHALATVARAERARLTLAVDSANSPALKLYYRHGMQRVTSKLAMMRDLRGEET
jgi:ribosomal protein S18 acetylase RimI-like enzyme